VTAAPSNAALERSAACGAQVRAKLLALDSMEELHTFLVNFSILDVAPSVDELACRAVALLRAHPPERIHHHTRCRLHSACAVEARLIGDTWWVPEEPSTHPLQGYLPGPGSLASLGLTGRGPVALGAAAAVGVGAGAVMWFLRALDN
jgi:hypothetical protein